FAEEQKDYRLEVKFPSPLLELVPEDKREAAMACLADDPRPSYQQDEERVYSMRFAECDIHFTVSGTTLTVTGVDV
ncbi:MAG: tRNA (N6-threonylcarbamoyladenosine(37)-N6)-methyltransferase TrmO, partial [Oscillospiraceae bacterium]|nr:tRNA (N6-threonylcarbamoyladenosine(37)-N6)-methyltransferase TrmO [Oscillospiraceae bacterium]